MRTTSELQKQIVKIGKKFKDVSSSYVRGEGIARSARDSLVGIGSVLMF